jgi:hypothetical protein
LVSIAFATQMGNQGHSGEGTHMMKEWCDAGLLGDVREVHLWSGAADGATDGAPKKTIDKAYKDRPLPKPSGSEIPEGLDWDLFLGPSAARPYVNGYARRGWFAWIEFCIGTCGNWGPHHLDASYWALQLGSPETIEAETLWPARPENSWPGWKGGGGIKVTWQFPTRGALPPVKVIFFSGLMLRELPRPKELEAGRKLTTNWMGGQLLFGDKATLLAGHTGGGPRLIPESKMQAVVKNLPPKTIERPKGGHMGSWRLACKGGKPAASHFEYAAGLMEPLLLGSIAIRTGRKMHWDAGKKLFKNDPEANAMLTREYRKGWDMRKL